MDFYGYSSEWQRAVIEYPVFRTKGGKRVKKLLIYILIFMLSISAAACGNSEKKDNGVKSKNELEGTVVVWSYGTAAKALQDAGNRFVKNHPKVKVEVKEIKENSYYDSIVVTLSSGIDMPDIFTTEGERVQYLASRFPGKLQELSEEVASNKDDYLKSKLFELSVNKKIYGYPWTSEPIAVFYREDMFKAAEISAEDIKTWEQYIDAGKSLAAYNKSDTKMLAVNDVEWLYRILLCQLGTGYFDNEGKPVFDSVDSIKAATMAKTLKDSNLVYSYSDLNSLISGIKNGKVAALPMDVSLVKVLKEQCGELNGKWAVMELPAFEFGGKTAASSGGLDIMVTTGAKNNKAAQEFARYAVKDTNVLSDMLIKNGLLSCYTPFFNELFFQNKVSYFNGQRTWRIFSKISKDVKEINHTENYVETQQSVKEALDKVIEKNEDIKTTLEELQKNTRGRYGKE